jgi:hypothetical protein
MMNGMAQCLMKAFKNQEEKVSKLFGELDKQKKKI